MSGDATLEAFRLSDSFLSVGTYTVSSGLEQFVHDDRVEDAADLEALLRTYLRQQVGPADLVALRAAHAGGKPGTYAAVLGLKTGAAGIEERQACLLYCHGFVGTGRNRTAAALARSHRRSATCRWTRPDDGRRRRRERGAVLRLDGPIHPARGCPVRRARAGRPAAVREPTPADRRKLLCEGCSRKPNVHEFGTDILRPVSIISETTFSMGRYIAKSGNILNLRRSTR